MHQVDEHLWLVTFMHNDLRYFDDETCRLGPIDFSPSQGKRSADVLVVAN